MLRWCAGRRGLGNRLCWAGPGESRHSSFVRLRPVCAFGRIFLMVATRGAACLRVGISLLCPRLALSISFIRPHRTLPNDRVGGSLKSQFLVRLSARTFRMGAHVFLFRAFPWDIAGGQCCFPAFPDILGGRCRGAPIGELPHAGSTVSKKTFWEILMHF